MKHNTNKHMNHRVKPALLAVAIATGIGLWPLNCWSGPKNEAERISDNLTEWIKSGSFTYDSKAHTYKTDSRYVFSAGEYSIRTPVYRINPLQISLPEINAGRGCSGIDLYMGSFSFITKDELKNFAKATVKGAPVYAFNLALNSIDPDIKNEIDKLRNLTHMLSAGQLDSCTTAQYGVNSIATLFHNERLDSQIEDRTIQHMWDSLDGLTPRTVWNKAVENDYIPFASASKDSSDSSSDDPENNNTQNVTVEDPDLKAIAAAKPKESCPVASDNVAATNTNTDCEIASLDQAMGYEVTGEYGNIMRLSSLVWIASIKKEALFKNTALIPSDMSNESVRNFVYSLFGTSYITFTPKSDGKTTKCMADGTSEFKAEKRTLKARTLIEGGNYSSIKSKNPTNKQTGQSNCWLIDTDFDKENLKWSSPSEYILSKIGDFSSVKYTNESGAVDTSSEGYKKLSEETILGNAYFSTSLDQGSIRDWTQEEKEILGIFPQNFTQALNNKEGANSPQLMYKAAKECIKPILAESYKALFKEMKDAVAKAINDYPSGKINQSNKSNTLNHLDSQYEALVKELDDYAGHKTALMCVKEILENQNGSIDQPTPIK